MQRVALIWTLLFALLAGCANESEQVAISETLKRAMTSLVNSDWAALWAVSDAASQKDLLELGQGAQTALECLDTVYDDEESRDKARKALGESWFKDIDFKHEDAGPKLLGRLLTPENVRFDQKAVDGLRVAQAIVDADRAVLHTLAGEEFSFHRDGKEWRSRMIVDLLEQNPDLLKLRESVKAVLEARDAHRGSWETSHDPKQPQGTYNLGRTALQPQPPDGATLYSLLNADSRKALVEALTAARDAQKLIQEHTKRNERTPVYAKHGITMYIKAASDQELYAAWVQSETYVPPFRATALPDKVEPGESEDSASVRTKDGEQIRLSRDHEGFWRLDHEATIREKLVTPAKTALKALSKD